MHRNPLTQARTLATTRTPITPNPLDTNRLPITVSSFELYWGTDAIMWDTDNIIWGPA